MKTAGAEAISARKSGVIRWVVLPLVSLIAASNGAAIAQTLYKYRGPDGEWIYSDRVPENAAVKTEQRTLVQKSKRAKLRVSSSLVGNIVELTAHNEFHAPMQVAINFDALVGIQRPHSDDSLLWVVPATSELTLLSLPLIDGIVETKLEFKYSYLPGDPRASHQPTQPYRVPFSVGNHFPISQAFPDAVTHAALDNRYAVDIAMPIGTDVVAARGGVVFDVASNNYRAGDDLQKDGTAANVVLILHDDGTFAVYAHLNWNSIRVNPGDRVQTGEYIADSGNTGFSSGPHLHFAVQKNAGFEIASLPVKFKGADARRVEPATGQMLAAYP